MNIQTVINNLRHTIAGKEMLLATYENPSINPYPPMVKATMVHMLETNITELKRILQDVEQCMPKEHVGDSNFESWYESYPQQGISKQVARDAYAAGMGDGQ